MKEHQCCYQVRMKTTMYRTRQCSFKGKTKVNGKWYCDFHNPDKVMERQKKIENNKKKRDKSKQNLYYANILLKAKGKKR